MNYFCCNEERRAAVKNHPLLNGIDYLEVVDNPADPFEVRQTILHVYLLKEVMPGSIAVENILIEGGERISNIEVLWAVAGPLGSPPQSPPVGSNLLTIKVKEAGDFSTYTLRLIGDNDTTPPDNFDPILSAVEFSFKVLCDNDFDCAPACSCEDAIEKAPDINYLAKDYGSFKQLMFDRMALLLPQWKERNPADPGVMLVELMAYVGDYLSYRQDAIATEAYLGTARKRVSVRRHARLVDYHMHDGCNARTWVHFTVKEGVTNLLLKKQNNHTTKLLTRSGKLPVMMMPGARIIEEAINEGSKVFELMHDVTLDARNNILYFYTWGNKNCSLPKGATSATFDTHLLAVQPGQVLIFEEIAGPKTGKASDADPKHRHAVMVTGVFKGFDPIGYPDASPPNNIPRPITEITWHEADALPFDLCISSVSKTGTAVMVSVAIGNNALADHGDTQTPELLPALPDADATHGVTSIVKSSCEPCKESTPVNIVPRYNPHLQKYPVTQTAGYPKNFVAASALLQWNIEDANAAIFLKEVENNETWEPLHDLLGCSANDKNFVVETESDGISSLRFGNDIQGKRPDSVLAATYRIGNGRAGNIGAEVLQHLITDDPSVLIDDIEAIRNPFPGTGGEDPESMAVVRNRAPIAFRKQERAVTMYDYEDVLKRYSKNIQRSTAQQRWTGSWRTVFVTVDRMGGKLVDDDFKKSLIQYMEKYRMAGEDVDVENPLFVALEIDITICVKPDYFRSQVKAAILELLSKRQLSNGKKGVFHPDNFSFGQPVYLSSIYTAAQQVAGVNSVTITKFQRQGQPASNALSSGILAIGRNEIARLDNDPNFREHGILNLTMEGGK